MLSSLLQHRIVILSFLDMFIFEIVESDTIPIYILVVPVQESNSTEQYCGRTPTTRA